VDLLEPLKVPVKQFMFGDLVQLMVLTII